jgi:CRP/FNR family transcriptional regulator
VVYLADDPSEKIYFLKKGKIKISKFSDDGKEHILAIIGPGELFGESFLTGEDIMGEDAEVLEDSIICSVDSAQFLDFLKQHPELNFNVTKLIGLKLKRIQSKLENLCFKTAEQRIIFYLKDLAENYGRYDNATNHLTLKMNITHDDLAKLTATTRQKVTTVLNSLSNQGFIDYSRKMIVIKDLTKL